MRGPEEEKPAKRSTHRHTIIFTGSARLPANAAAAEMLGSLAVELEVDSRDMRILDVACNCMPPLGQKLLINLLVGRELEEGLQEAIEEIPKRYFSVLQRAMIAALKEVQERYKEFQEARRKQAGSPKQSRKG